jgi:hypothetical protein
LKVERLHMNFTSKLQSKGSDFLSDTLRTTEFSTRDLTNTAIPALASFGQVLIRRTTFFKKRSKRGDQGAKGKSVYQEWAEKFQKL